MQHNIQENAGNISALPPEQSGIPFFPNNIHPSSHHKFNDEVAKGLTFKPVSDILKKILPTRKSTRQVAFVKERMPY